MSKAAKYEKKINKALAELEQLSDKKKNDVKRAEFQDTLKKYQEKLAQLKDDEVVITEAETVCSDKATSSNIDVDKSGMTLLLFYAYVEPAWSPPQHKATIDWADGVLRSNDCTGRLRVAREGFNGTLTGSYDGIRAFTDAVRGYNNGSFAHMNNKDDFKLTDNLPIKQKFPKLKVFSVKELVNYGLGVDNAPSVFNGHGGVHLHPEEYHKKLQEDNTVVIDVRNSYENEIGRFEPRGGCEYIDPEVSLFDAL